MRNYLISLMLQMVSRDRIAGNESRSLKKASCRSPDTVASARWRSFRVFTDVFSFATPGITWSCLRSTTWEKTRCAVIIFQRKLKKKKKKRKKIRRQVVTEIMVCYQVVTVFRIPQRAKAARQDHSPKIVRARL